MSGHSKWATIKRQKEVKDAKRGNLFTKLGNAISLAAKQGGADPDSNFSLRLAMEKAKAVNMPKDNIQRAIQRGTGELGGQQIEELTYGARLPGQVAVIIKCFTDNKNRTLTEIKTAITKNGGQFVDLNSIAWQFENKGVIKLKKQETRNKKQGEIEMNIIDSGAEDYEESDEELIIYTKPADIQLVKSKLEDNGIKICETNFEMVAKQKRELNDETLNKVVKILEALDEIDEVSGYYTNLS